MANVPRLSEVRGYIVKFNPEAAEAAKYQFAVPAEQLTRQAEEVTRQSRELTKRRAMEGLVLGGGLYVMANSHESAWPAAIMVAAVLGTIEGIDLIKTWLAKKSP